MEPAVAMVPWDQKEGEVAGCWGEEVEVASYPLEEAADSWGVHEVPDPGPWGEAEAASKGEAGHWGCGAEGGLPCWAWGVGSCGVPRGHRGHRGLHALHALHACYGSSCSQSGQSSSKEAGSVEVDGCCWGLRTDALLPGY